MDRQPAPSPRVLRVCWVLMTDPSSSSTGGGGRGVPGTWLSSPLCAFSMPALDAPRHQRGFSYHPPPTPSSGVSFLLSGASRDLTALQAFTGSLCLLPSPPACHGRPWTCSEAAVGWLATRRKEGSCFSTFIPKYQCDRLNMGLPKHIHFHFINNLKCQCTGLSDCVTQIVGLDLIIGRSRDVICKGETQEYARTLSSLLKARPQT